MAAASSVLTSSPRASFIRAILIGGAPDAKRALQRERGLSRRAALYRLTARQVGRN
jgi:hypothetical protein